MSPIPYTRPSIGALEQRYAADAVANGWGPHCYDYLERFEQAFAAHLGVPHVIATSSCTGALHMGLAALGIGAGDEVILGDINWIASAAPVTYLGATPVFVDVLPDSWCLDPARVEAAITPRTRAIIAVHLYGNLADLDALLAIGERHGIPVIEDAAEAIGSGWRRPDGRVQRAGTRGAFGVFSFHGTKTLTTGEGGAFVTHDAELYARVLTLSNHGRAADTTRQFWPTCIGFKYKLSNVQAAIGLAQVDRVDELIAAKRRVFFSYTELMQDIPGDMNPEPAGTLNGFWMPTLVAYPSVPFDREALLADFAREGIDGRVFFWPLSSLPMFTPRPENTVAWSIHQRGINLPSHHELSLADIDRVSQVVSRHLRRG
jgi:perosamine synthetase